MSIGKRLVGSFAAAAALALGMAVTGCSTTAVHAQAQETQQPAVITLPAYLTEKFNTLAHACTQDGMNVGANATIAVPSDAAAEAGKARMTITPDGKMTFALSLTDEERAALQRDLDDFWTATAAELNASTDLPNPAPEGFDHARLREALNDNLPAFKIRATHDLGVPVTIAGFNYKIPQPGCPATPAPQNFRPQ
jgi:hypothetical protein